MIKVMVGALIALLISSPRPPSSPLVGLPCVDGFYTAALEQVEEEAAGPQRQFKQKYPTFWP